MQQGFQMGAACSQVRHPYRGIGNDHVYFLADLLRGIGCRSLSVPPSSASLLLLSRAIKASKPSLTREVFSLTPVNSEALFSISSSIFSVVLICINMHDLGIHVKWHPKRGELLIIQRSFYIPCRIPLLSPHQNRFSLQSCDHIPDGHLLQKCGNQLQQYVGFLNSD